MKFTLSWLKFFLDTEATVAEICQKLTMIGLEVEQVIDHNIALAAFKVAKIIKAIPHPNADKLKICQVDIGVDEYLQIVCGASNARVGIKVVLAEVGVIVPKGQFKIKAAEIRGIKSYGMLCSEDELNIGNNSSGIIELPDEAVVGEKFLKYYGLDDPVIDINVTPNRGDCLGVYGIARDLSAAGLGKLRSLSVSQQPTDFISELNITITQATKEVLRVDMREIRNITNKQSPSWLKHLLKNVGIMPVSAIVDITNYISCSFARPLHAYDRKKVGRDIIFKQASLNQQFKALNDKEYCLVETDIVAVDINDNIHALAGIIGSNFSACTEESTHIILESALFDKISVTKTARRLNINTEARQRFERQVDPSFINQGLELATKMILEICGGEASNIIIKAAENDTIQVKNIDFCLTELRRMIGIDIAQDLVTKILTDLGFLVLPVSNQPVHSTKKQLKLQVPSWRADINIAADIVEEIVRIYGYDNIPAIALPTNGFLATNLISSRQRRINEAKHIMSARGLNEMYSWSFMNSKKASLFATLKDELYITNPIANNLDYMRPTILPNLLEIIVKNQARSITDFGLFEIGPVFTGVKTTEEQMVINAVRVGNIVNKTPFDEQRQADVYDVKADFQQILTEFNFDFDKLKLDLDIPEYFHPNRAASFKLGKVVIANIGEIHPQILANFGITERVSCFEMFLDNLPNNRQGSKNRPYIISDFQPSKRDFAFLVNENMPVGEITSFIKNLEKSIIKQVRIFDIFQGKNIEIGKKSIALSVQIQANDRTLTEMELQNICTKIINEVEQKFSAKVRDGCI